MSKKSRTSLRALRTFCVAASHESFRTAADELFITPSAVSHQVKSLEEELGEQLFERGGRTLELTETGKSLFAEANPLIEQLDHVMARYRQDKQRTPIRISVQPFFASEYFVPRLTEFTDQHSEFDIQIGTSDESSDKHPADADLSIRLFRSPPADLASDLLFPLRLAPAAAPAFAKKLVVKNNAIVSDFPLIVHETQPKAWERWSERTGIKLPEDATELRFDSMIAVARAAERGVGACMMPVPLGNEWFESGRLVALFDQELRTNFSYYMLSAADRADDPLLQAPRQWILDAFAGH
ncbi:MAG: LysR family transcriptional regulator [Gammaproteobacteria bacterium]|nr:LysR family transcriptional regulator [Gammaproteobacteria bacterium]